MEETLKMMKNVIEGYEATKSINELLQEYKQRQNSNILAYLFIKNYKLIKSFELKYRMLNTQDIASYSLQELDNAINTFDFDRQCSFITYFYANLKNRLFVETKKLKTSTNIANYSTVDLADYLEVIDKDFTFDNLKDYNLSKEQEQLCNFLLDGYSCPQIAKLLKVSHTCIYNKVKELRQFFIENSLRFE